MAASIPESHRDLLQSPVHGVLTTLMPGGAPQSSVVWVDYDGEHLLLNTTLERQKGRNLRRDPRATVLVIDPNDTSRWIEVRCRVTEITTAGAEAHADALTRRYTGKQKFYGDIYAVERKQQETRVIVRLAPVKVSVDAIFR
jgi:PPOX class probable F420-dependent enzyme